MNFVAIGSTINPFKGTFNGANFSIVNLTINGVTNHTALFAKGVGAIVTNLVMLNVNVNCSFTCVAALLGECDQCFLENIHLSTSSPLISSQITGPDLVGGIVGSLCNSIIKFCSVQNTFVKGYTSSGVGGIAGQCNMVNMTNCYNFGEQFSLKLFNLLSFICFSHRFPK